ncbi:hypothetical protein IAR50_001825 [Cryptococcus sp. DSM 104548]
MASFCFACSRRVFAASKVPSRIAPVPRTRHFSLLATSRRPEISMRALSPSSYRSATTSSIGSSSSAAPHLPPIPTRPNIKVTAPSLAAIKEEGFLDDDVKLLPPEEAFLNISPEAVQQLCRITAREPLEILQRNKLALRVGVESGGCHGYQYLMDITEERGVDDYVMQPEGVHCIPIVVDLTSLGLLKGATLHHATELIGSSFRLQDNPQAKEGGACGCGVSWEAK